MANYPFCNDSKPGTGWTIGLAKEVWAETMVRTAGRTSWTSFKNDAMFDSEEA